MGKLLPLVRSSIKGFARNWRSVVLLIVFPLLLIGVIFTSFNPNGMQKIPVGFINEVPLLETSEFADVVTSFVDLTEYDDLDSCLAELKSYNEYVCVNAILENVIVLNVHFDNTREPIIWGVIQQIKDAVNYIQKEKAKELATEFRDEFTGSLDSSDVVKTQVATLRKTVEDTSSSIRIASDQITQISRDVKDPLSNIQVNSRNIVDESQILLDTENDGHDMFNENMEAIFAIIYASSMSSEEINELTDNLNEWLIDTNANHDAISGNTYNIRTTGASFDVDAKEISGSFNVIDRVNDNLRIISSNMGNIGYELNVIENQIDNVANGLRNVEDLDPEMLVNPIVIKNLQTYIPEYDASAYEGLDENTLMSQISKGINLIGLQTIFPSVLILIVMFLSILISSFITLKEINSDANIRIRTMKHIFAPHFFSVYISSLIIVSIPILCVLMVGEFLFQLPLFSSISLLAPMIFLLTSIFVFFGMALAFLIKNESITLLISTFALLFLIFMSGFILPIERMSVIPGIIAQSSPGTVLMQAFNQIVFYHQPLSAVMINAQLLGVWFISMLATALVMKWLRKA